MRLLILSSWNMAFCVLYWQFTDSSSANTERQTEARTSKHRWRVSNIGAEQDEGITSPEIKGQASLTHQNKTTASPRSQYLSPVTTTFKRSCIIFCLQSVWQCEWWGMCAACEWVSVGLQACVLWGVWVFNVGHKREIWKRKKQKRRDRACSAGPVFVLSE